MAGVPRPSPKASPDRRINSSTASAHGRDCSTDRVSGYTGCMAKVVAVIGASSDRRRYGNKAVRAFGHKGFTVVPDQRRRSGEIEGLTAYPTVLDVPGPIDLATFYVRPEIGLRVIDEVARKGIPEVWLNPGAGSAELERKAQALGIRTVSACSILAIGEDRQPVLTAAWPGKRLLPLIPLCLTGRPVVPTTNDLWPPPVTMAPRGASAPLFQNLTTPTVSSQSGHTHYAKQQ